MFREFVPATGSQSSILSIEASRISREIRLVESLILIAHTERRNHSGLDRKLAQLKSQLFSINSTLQPTSNERPS